MLQLDTLTHGRLASTHKSPSCTNWRAAMASPGATNTRLVLARSCSAGAAEQAVWCQQHEVSAAGGAGGGGRWRWAAAAGGGGRGSALIDGTSVLLHPAAHHHHALALWQGAGRWEPLSDSPARGSWPRSAAPPWRYAPAARHGTARLSLRGEGAHETCVDCAAGASGASCVQLVIVHSV